jgi:hypothetical protein
LVMLIHRLYRARMCSHFSLLCELWWLFTAASITPEN